MWDIFPKVWDRDDHPAQDDHSQTTIRADGPVVDNKDQTNTQSGELSDTDSIIKDAQAGVQDVEATSKAWTKKDLIVVYFFIYCIYIINSLGQQIANSLSVYATSAFSAAPLVATTGVLSSIIGGLSRLPLAKILDVWGRPQGLCLMVACLTLGLIIMAGCNRVETYAAGQVFYWVGLDGIQYTLSVFIADTTLLKNRGLMLAFASTPYIFTTFAGGPAAQSFVEGAGWRWGFGTFAIVTPFVAAPVIIIFLMNKKKAQNLGLINRDRAASGRTLPQSIWFYIIEVDLIGIILLVAGLALFLLPFSLYSYQPKGWSSPLIICFLVFGIVLLIAFGLYEKFLAPKTFLPMHLLADRTILGGCIWAGIAFLSFYIWDSFFYSFLLVVNDQPVKYAVYIINIYSIGSCFWGVITGLLIRGSGRVKWLALYFGVPMTILGIALMIAFRHPDVNIGYIIMCQIFIAFGGGTTVICQEIIILAATNHQNVAVVLALQNAFTSIGGAIGSTIATAIWTDVFPMRLREYLPADTEGEWSKIYGSVTVQQSYAVGTPTRTAINRAYGDAQRIMLISAVAIVVFGWSFVFIWRDISVKGRRNVKGTVI